MPDEKTSQERRAVLEETYDKLAAPEPAPEAPPAPPVAAPEPEQEKLDLPPVTEDRQRDEKGRFAPKTEPDVTKGTEPVVPPVAPPVTPPPEPEIPVPISWRASERDFWKNIPKEARAPILRREEEITKRLSTLKDLETAEQNWKRFQEVYKPYEHIMRLNGTNDPVQSAQNLFNTAAILQTGNPQQQAATVAQVMRQFNVDPGLVASYLEGQPPQQGQPQQFRDPRFDQFLATLEQSRAEKAQKDKARMAGELDAFAKGHEFFEDVRADMADLIDAWDAAGKLEQMTLPVAMQKAYDYAILMNEETSKAVKQREAAKAITTAQAATEKAKAAASTPKSSPGLTGKSKPTDRREVLRQKYEELDK